MRPTEEDYIDFCARRGIDETDETLDAFLQWIEDGPESQWDTREEQRGEK
jgi:hypothetical protein